MADKSKFKPIIPKTTTPKGVFQYPHLNKPDTKFDPEGTYRLKLRLEGVDAEKLKAIIDKGMADSLELAKSKEEKPALRAKIKAADLPYQPETDKDSGEETGATLFTFKQKAQITAHKGTAKEEIIEKKPDLFDAAGKRFPPKTLIYGGTVGKIAFEGVPFYTAKLGAGVSLRLLAAQIIELRSSGSRGASDYGFGEEGEGLEHNDSTGEGSTQQPADGDGESTDF